MGNLFTKAKKPKASIVQNRISNPFPIACEKLCTIEKFDTTLSSLKPKEVNIVSISIKNPTKQQLEIVGNGLPYPYSKSVTRYNENYCQFIFEHFKKALEVAVSKTFKGNIICINELGMPLAVDGYVNEEAIEFAKKIANDNNCLIVAGSKHSIDSYANEGFIFYPGKDLDQNEYRRFYKNISATSVNEEIFIPSRKKIYRTEAFGLGIASLICLELIDYTSAVSVGRSREHIDLLLVPTYSEDYGVMDKVAKNLSIPIGGVLLNNCFISDDHYRSNLYMHGEMKDIMKNTRTLDKKTYITKRTINVSSFLNEKKLNIHKHNEEINHLYGHIFFGR